MKVGRRRQVMAIKCRLPSATSVVVGDVAQRIDQLGWRPGKGEVLSRWWSKACGADFDLVVRRVGVGGIQVDG